MEFVILLILTLASNIQVFAWREGQLNYPHNLGVEGDVYEDDMVGVDKRGEYFPQELGVFENVYEAKRGSGGLTSSQKREFVKKHNELRQSVSPSAANMEKLEWDSNLERLAQRWADQCIYEHPHPDHDYDYKDIGQNLYFDTDKSDVSLPVQLWYDEVKDYDYNSDECGYGKVCTHYTQVVWGKTNRIGCAIAQCSSLSQPQSNPPKSFDNVWYYVCQYSPGGNQYGVQPYLSGEPCTQCESGTCKDGLCSKCRLGSPGCECKLRCQNCGSLTNKCKCKCPKGFEGTSCSERCEDLSEHCNKSPGYPKGACGKAAFVAEYCPKMCEVCTPPDDNFRCNK